MIKTSEWREIVEKNMSDIFSRYGFSFDEEGEKYPPAMEVYVVYKSEKSRLKFYYDQRNWEQNVNIQRLLGKEDGLPQYEEWSYVQDIIKKHKNSKELHDRAVYIQNLPFEDLSWIRELLEEYLPDIFGEAERQ